MKRTLILATMLILACSAFCQSQHAQIEFENRHHNFDTIAAGKTYTCEFVYTNTGIEPLVVQDAKTSCGCTVPEWDKRPTFNGKRNSLKVKFNASLKGPFRKTIVVVSNDPNTPKSVLQISGVVAGK